MSEADEFGPGGMYADGPLAEPDRRDALLNRDWGDEWNKLSEAPALIPRGIAPMPCTCCRCQGRKCMCDHPGHDHRSDERYGYERPKT